ncbi:MAG: VWA domain-containing protein [Fimbriimonadaceae bacterium]|nr:VWA domain-containing protein [Fimbriimonadaceae bacterium]
MADGLRLRTALDKAYRPLQGEFLTTVLVELTPPRALTRLPLNLGLLLDTSESMNGEKLRRAREAATALIAALSPQDLVTLVVFNSEARTLLHSAPAGAATEQQAAEALRHLAAEGVTSLLPGIESIFYEVSRHAGPDRTSFVLLLSDGYPTTVNGYVDEDRDPYVRRVDREMHERGISLTCIGLGDAANYDQGFLRRLADSGNGQFLYCPELTDLTAQFGAEFARIQRTVLNEVTLTARHLGGEVRRLWRVYPEKKLFDDLDLRGDALSVPLGTFQEGQPQAYLLDIVTPEPPAAQPGRARLLEVEATWLDEGRARQATVPVVYELTDNERALAQRNPEVVRLATECIDALLEEQLESAVSGGDRARQTAVLARKKQLTKRLGKVEATRVLEEMEATLDQGGQITQDALARSSQATRPTERLG